MVWVMMLVVAAGTAAAGPVAGAGAVGQAATVDGSNNSTELGGSVSSFMQSSAAIAEETVDTGMWSAAFERANESERARMVHDRASTLEQRVQRLEAERAELLNASDGGVTVAERARAARLAARADALRDAIDRTQTAAASAGVNASRLEELRTNARNLGGQEVADLARGIAGPPGDRGPQSDAGDARDTPPGLDDGWPPANGNGDDRSVAPGQQGDSENRGAENANRSDSRGQGQQNGGAENGNGSDSRSAGSSNGESDSVGPKD